MKKTLGVRMRNLLVLVLIVLISSSCFFGKKKSGAINADNWKLNDKTSTTTGWNYNDPKQGGFQTGIVNQQPTAPGMVFIEGGTFTMGQSDEDVTYNSDKAKRRITVNSFYMDQYEVTNRAWHEYLYWLSMVYGQSNPEVIKSARPDTLCWRKELSYNEPMLENYFSHTSFSFYPVVGVSWEQAVEYCKWRTDRVNEATMAKRGIINMPDYSSAQDGGGTISDVYTTDRYFSDPSYDNKGKTPLKDAWKNPRKVTRSDGIIFPSYRLPTEAEWEYAAYALLNEKGKNSYYEKKIFPWNGHYMRTPPGKKTRGVAEFKANFVNGRGDMMGQAGALNDGALYTAPVDAYEPNDFGLYNMAGNVNEWVADVYRPMSSEEMDEYSPFRGNVFKSTVDGANDGTGLDSLYHIRKQIEVDTLADGTPVSQDYRNAKDGDGKSSLDRDTWKLRGVDTELATDKMYNGDKGAADGILNSTLSNTIRVYKGGSWNDRAHWLNPGTRRYLEQKKSSSEIGFRCAMDRVGTSSGQKGLYESRR